MKQLVLATANAHKVEEMKSILAPLGVIEILSILDFPDMPEIEETEKTFEGNAILKAEACAEHTGKLSLADDSGIVVDALDGRPGVFSARYAPTSAERNAKMLGEMEGVPSGKLTARYVAAMALGKPDGRTIVRLGKCEGEVAVAPRGESGFGYDPIFWLPDRERTMAELSEQEKNAISHRGRAIEAILPDLREALNSDAQK